MAVVDFNNRVAKAADLSPELKTIIGDENIIGRSSLTDYIKTWTVKATTVHQLWASWYVLENNGMKDDSQIFIEKICASSPGMSHEVLFCVNFINISC
jgi:hypothetical protein